LIQSAPVPDAPAEGVDPNRCPDSRKCIVTSVESPLSIEIVDPFCDREWDQLALSHPKSSVFHLSVWARVLQQTYGQRPVYLRVRDQRRTVALIPSVEVSNPLVGVRGIATPFSDFCKPLIFERSGIGRRLVQALVDFGRSRGWRSFELRGGRTVLPPQIPASAKYYVHDLKLPSDPEQLFGVFDDSVRRAIRKAENSGLTVELGQDWCALRDFYKLHVRTRRRHGLPPQPLSFFRNIQKFVMEKGFGFVVLAKAAKRPVAGAVFFHSAHNALFKFGASDFAAQNLRGNNLVMWLGIRRLIELGIETVSFGRTEIENDGLRRFKLGWGSVESMIEYFKCRLNPEEMWVSGTKRSSTIYVPLFRITPLLVNRAVGRMVYRYLS
jgi:Acetyltransferase (GNAT) domain